MAKKYRVQAEFLKSLSENPNLTAVCKKHGISRQTIYRWKKEDQDFSQLCIQAENDGENFMNDMMEHNLIKLGQKNNLGAIKYYLSHRHRKYTKGAWLSTDYQHRRDPDSHEAWKLIELNNEIDDNKSNK